MKRILLSFALCLSFGAFITAQTIVSTNPENKNAILEEFTGINCQFCPDGHAIANGIKANHPNDFFIINIHAGGFANPGAGQPDFRTEEGAAIDAQADVAGYPAGTINRTVFPGLSQNPGGTAMSRNFWANATNQILAESSYVNVAVEAEINTDTNVLKVHVEAYYTGDSPVSTNKLNVALLQNNTLGPQSPADPGNTYMHMHRLVDMLTGTWGDDITTTTQGTFVDRTYSYYIPDNYRGVPVDINTAGFEVVAFVAEGQQTIISGDGATATFVTGLQANDAMLKSVTDNSIVCTSSLSPQFELYNVGSNFLTSLNIQYSVNGEAPQSYTWTGTLPSLATELVTLPEVAFTTQATNTVVISLPNDDDNSNNSGQDSFSYSSEQFITPSVNLTIVLDDWPQETTWEIKDSSGAVIHSGGPYPGQDFQTINANNLALATDDCYTFEIFDAYGDGICCGFGNGSYTLETQSGDVIITGGNFGSSEDITFANYDTLSNDDFNLSQLSVYPNPTTGILNISLNNSFSYEIYDLQGRVILNGTSDEFNTELNLDSFSNGVYLVKVSSGNSTQTKKIILK